MLKYIILSELRKLKDFIFPFKAFEKKKKNEINFYNTFKKQQHSKNELRLDSCRFIFTEAYKLQLQITIYNYCILRERDSMSTIKNIQEIQYIVKYFLN